MLKRTMSLSKTKKPQTSLMERLQKSTDANNLETEIDEHDYVRERKKKKELMMIAKSKLLLAPTVISAAPKFKFIIKEDNKFKFAWDLLAMVAVLYVAFVTPYRLSFDLSETAQPWSAINKATTILFTIDIVLTFFTEVYLDDEFVTVSNLREIAMIYIKGWFLFDLVSVLPLDTFFKSLGSKAGNVNSTIRVFRVLRVYKLIRLLRISKLVRSVMSSRMR
jgi:hypothetical protein